MNKYCIDAYGKINLGLDVIGRREDGYHLVKMVMQTVGLYDTLEFEKTEGPEIIIKTGTDELPSDKGNLIYRAVEMVRERFGIKEGVSVKLTKRIPIAAGMAGGSTDAAASLKAMKTLFELDIPEEELYEMGLRLGADVPYCLMGGTALAEGIGEILTRLPSVPEAKVLLVKPPIGISTAVVYRRIDTAGVPVHPDIDGIITQIKEKNTKGYCKLLGNVLEMVSCSDYPIIDEIKAKMTELGADASMMSGSGPTVFGIFTDYAKADEAYRYFKRTEFQDSVFLTDFV